MNNKLCARMGCGDTKTVRAYICLDYDHVYEIWLCEKHAKELKEFKGDVLRRALEK